MLKYFGIALVPAKVTPLQPRCTWVSRPRLNKQLATPHIKVTLVVAPAGFGKSTAVAQWLNATAGERSIAVNGRWPMPDSNGLAEHPIAWLTLDEHDKEGLPFLAYVVGAITSAAPGALTTTLQLATAPSVQRTSLIMRRLLADLSALPLGLTLVLDDYQAISGDEIHRLVTHLISYLPPSCRVVLISRAEPSLPLHRLRAEGQLLEIGPDELRFTNLEADALLTNVYGKTIETERVALLYEQTEGWAIGLQLAALTQRGAGASAFVQTKIARQMVDYLAEEVFARQPAALQAALLAFAVPEQICTALGAALLGAPAEARRAEKLIDQLVQANLFLTPLDAEGRWYRFHHLFRNMLLSRLYRTASHDQVRTLLLRTANWFADERLVGEAVRYYRDAGDDERTVTLIEQTILSELADDKISAPSAHWLQLLPEAIRMNRLNIALLEARFCFQSIDVPGLEAALDRVEALLTTADAEGRPLPWPTFRVDLLALRGLQYYYQHRPHEAISYFETALAQRIGLGLTEQALLFLGRSYVAAGRFDEGVQRIEQHQGPAGSSWQQASEVNRLGTLSSMYGLAGDLAAEERHVEHLASAHTITESMAGYIDVTLGYIAYERDDLVTAHMYFERLLGRKFIVSHPVYMFGLAGLIVTALANGSFDVADALVQEAFAFAEEVGTPFLRHQAQGCATRVALGRGDIAAALECAETIEADVHLGLSLALDAPRLTQVCALIAAGDEASYAQADALLHTCLAEIEAFHNIRMQIRALAILALLRQAQQRPVDALQALKHAIRLGEPRGFLRTFLDLGPTRLPLIEALAARGVAPSYLQQLSGDAALAVAFRPPERPMASSLGVNRLTSREHEILVLLADRWSDKEIAERLVISLSTVRKHTTTIYDKLGVHSRRDAVTAAQSLGLLSPP